MDLEPNIRNKRERVNLQRCFEAMPRVYRYVIVAAVGWLTLCAQHPVSAPNLEKRQTDGRVGDALTNIAMTYREQAERVEHAPERQSCGPDEYKSNDDLCAQWKAADAADRSAWWAAFAGWFGGLGFLGVLAAVGMAFHSNWIARDTAKRQLRAYVTVDDCTMTVMDAGQGCLLQVVLKNCGQTPAFNLRLYGESFADKYPIPEIKRVKEMHANYGTVVGPGQSTTTVQRLTGDMQRGFADVASGEIGFYIQGVCEYADIFGKVQRTTFRYVHGGRPAEAGPFMHAAESGNDAT